MPAERMIPAAEVLRTEATWEHLQAPYRIPAEPLVLTARRINAFIIQIISAMRTMWILKAVGQIIAEKLHVLRLKKNKSIFCGFFSGSSALVALRAV